jgi:hypothetical protein
MSSQNKRQRPGPKSNFESSSKQQQVPINTFPSKSPEIKSLKQDENKRKVQTQRKPRAA